MTGKRVDAPASNGGGGGAVAPARPNGGGVHASPRRLSFATTDLESWAPGVVGDEPGPGKLGTQRPRVQGKFLFVGSDKLYIKGVTYGPFRPQADGSEYGTAATAARDFAEMAAAGVNAIRIYTAPPRWLLDLARTHGIRVLIGIPWEQHITFLDDRARRRGIVAKVRATVRACAGHPAVLAYAVGNEIPAPIVRWYGAARVERFIRDLYEAVKAEDPEALVTYVNYPTTEYLWLPFLDFVSFNVYLETEPKLTAYLARVQNLTGDRPLVMGEIGLDSRRNGQDRQAETLGWQVRASFAAGCAGAFVFKWTDEWYRGGHDIEDWDFGLVARDRTPKLALDAVRLAFGETPFPADTPWPRVSVIVCSYNGHRTIGQTLEGLAALDYPDYEVIVVDDGSAEPLEPLVRPFQVRYIRTENAGLSSARDRGRAAATGAIVAYIDDDAYPDRHWLKYLASTFLSTRFAGVGGPNLPPREGGPIADCVANAPGGPMHVLLSDREAEHIPGCNMAFWRKALETVGGFDAQFWAAGDDVDLCWRIQAAGMRIGYSPAAVVWHHRRDSVRGYWRQQRGYGRAEAMLERKWPEKYNVAGHIPWAGRIYSGYLNRLTGGRPRRIYHGTWGTAPFQRLYQPRYDRLSTLLAMPEWYLVLALLTVLAGFGLFWTPLLAAAPFLGLALGLQAIYAGIAVAGLEFPSRPRTVKSMAKRYALTWVLHLIQPVARLSGRLREGLTPWRTRSAGVVVPLDRSIQLWSERWQPPEVRLALLETALHVQRMVTVRGGDFDRWDLEVRGGLAGGARLMMAIEEHGAGKQLVRIRTWIRPSPRVLWSVLLIDLVALACLFGAHPAIPVVLFALVLLILGRALFEGSRAMAAVEQATKVWAMSAFW